MSQTRTAFSWLGPLVSALGAGILLTLLYVRLDLIGLALGIGTFATLALTSVILRRPHLGLSLILFFLPFERIPSIEVGGITVRLNFFFGAVTVLATLLALLSRKLRLQPYPIGWPLAVFLLLSLVTALTSIETERLIQVLVFTVFTLAVGWLPTVFVTDTPSVRKVVVILLASFATVILFGLYQFLGDFAGLPEALTGLDPGYTKAVFGFPRVQAFSIEPLYLGNYLLIPLSLCLSFVLTKAWPRAQVVLTLLMLLGGIILVLTVSRGAYLGGALAIAVLLLTLPRESLQPSRLLFGLLLVATVGFASYGFLSQGGDQAIDEYVEHALLGDLQAGESTQGRLSAFSQALAAWDTAPWLGIGLGNFGSHIEGYPDPRTVTDVAIVNNQYLELLAETGFLGLTLILAVFALVIGRSIVALRATDDAFVRATVIGLTAALLGILAQYNFFSTLYIIHIWVLIGLLTAVQTVALRTRQ